MPPTTETQQDAWPEGVIVRYVTVWGATVDLSGTNSEATGVCTGCLAVFPDHTHLRTTLNAARGWAQGHAEKCLALPRPTA